VSLSNVGNSQAAINKINGSTLNGSQYAGDVDIYVVLNSANSSTPVNIDPYCPIFSSGNNGLTLSIPNTSSSYTAINITANGSLVHSFNKSFSLNQWYHIALTSDNDAGVFTVYVNGYSLGSVSNSVSWTDSSPYTIGYESANSFHFGPAYLSNFRIVNGSVIYNGIFTPSVNALLPVSNTALLLTANPISPLSDTSGNNITVSGVNSPTANTISPFYEPGNIVSSSVGRVNDPTIGSSRKVMRSVDPYGNVMPSGVFDEVSLSSGSILLNGSTQYLTVSNVGGLSGNALTLETWVYMTGYSSPTSSSPIFSSGSNGLTLSILNTASSYTGMGLYANGSLLQSFNKSFSLNQWYHIALTRNSSGVFTVYVNGSSIGTVTNTTTWTDSSPYNVGYDSSTSFYFGPGYLSNFRIVDGSVVYSSNFTPADGPLLPVGNTGLLLTSNPMNPFADTSGNNVSVSLVANPSFSTISPFYAAGKASSSVGTVSNPTLGSAVQIAQSMDLNGNIMMSNGFDEVSS
jgi:hypothetical protein